MTAAIGEKSPVQVRSIMSAKVATVSPRTSLVTVSRLMAEKRISCVIVLEKDHVIGIISERDIVNKVSSNNGRLNGTTARHVMTSPVETLPAGTQIEKAVTLMSEKGFRRFPIVSSKGKLRGIVTRSDILRAYVREIEIAHEKMKDLAIRDCLTGIFNRRFLMATLEREFYRSRRHKTPLALIMFDLDDFKKINDEYGHQHGDNVLRTIGGIIIKHTRGGDMSARFGGEEFIVIAPDTKEREACAMAERLRRAIEQSGNTASFGVSVYPESGGRFPDDIIRQSDNAMYEAKRLGKNQVVCWNREMSGI